MDVRINQLTSTVHTTDSGVLLSPELMRQLRLIIQDQVREELDRQRRLHHESALRQGVISHEDGGE
jgi:hypothetical protein